MVGRTFGRGVGVGVTTTTGVFPSLMAWSCSVSCLMRARRRAMRGVFDSGREVVGVDGGKCSE